MDAHFVENSADREWLWSQYTPAFSQWRIDYEKRDGPLVEEAAGSGNIEPNLIPNPDLDPTDSTKLDLLNMTVDILTLAKRDGQNSLTLFVLLMSKTTQGHRKYLVKRQSMSTLTPTQLKGD